jgi:DNA-3-methyladenine glycosylase
MPFFVIPIYFIKEISLDFKDYVRMKILPREFYNRDTEEVARELLGNKLFRRMNGELLGGIIVETEAYYGSKDPASRAYHGKKRYNEAMWGKPGQLFIYNVHQYWMLNIVAHKPSEVGGVLIRAIQPTKGLDTMRSYRPVDDIIELTSGPGKLTIALNVNKSFNMERVTNKDSRVIVVENQLDFELERTHRIGVTKDLEEKLRFYIKENPFVSKT